MYPQVGEQPLLCSASPCSAILYPDSLPCYLYSVIPWELNKVPHKADAHLLISTACGLDSCSAGRGWGAKATRGEPGEGREAEEVESIEGGVTDSAAGCRMIRFYFWPLRLFLWLQRLSQGH